jgi:general stress protein 26
MGNREPVAELHEQFSSKGATATSWAEARQHLEKAEVFWLSTVRPDGRPHVTPMVSVWLDGALYFSTGPTERKAQNLAQNSHCIITTGCNSLSEGLDLVIEGDAAMVTDHATLERVADKFGAKYDAPFRFAVRDFASYGEGGETLVFEVTPTRAFGYGRDDGFSATRWVF